MERKKNSGTERAMRGLAGGCQNIRQKKRPGENRAF
jgi:hypothetical protein